MRSKYQNIKSLKRAVCWFLYYLFVKHLPGNYKPYSLSIKKLRALICKPLFKKFGKNVDINNKVDFFNARESEIGSNSGIGAYSSLGTVHIGDYVMMGTHCLILSQNHRFDDCNIPMCKQGFQTDLPVKIEDDVWIGSRVIILPGVVVGKGSVIGAGSVVTKNIHPYSIVGGNPARIIGKRCEDKKNN